MTTRLALALLLALTPLPAAGQSVFTVWTLWSRHPDLAARLVAAGVRVHVFSIQATHMFPTLDVGDLVAVDLREAGRLPRRGEMVAIQEGDAVLIRRVVGLPGDRVAFEAGRLRLNGTLVPLRCTDARTVEPPGWPGAATFDLCEEYLPGAPATYKIFDQSDGFADFDDLPDHAVPLGHVYLLADNRWNSLDSRHPDLGPVPIAAVKGRVLLRLGPSFGWLVDERSVPGIGP